jgi:hypothetical protein
MMRTPEQTEDRKAAIKQALVESYMYCCGMDEPTARLAAGADEGKKIIDVFNICERLGR